jgi:hypothetical protein
MSFTVQWSYTGAQSTEINLVGQQDKWRSFNSAIISQNESGLEILVVTNQTDKTWNRAYLPILISSSNDNPIHFTLEYASKSYLGNATFQAQVRHNSSKVLWNIALNNTSAQLITKSFTLPSSILNRPLEFRLYITTKWTAQQSLDVKKTTLI